MVVHVESRLENIFGTDITHSDVLFLHMNLLIWRKLWTITIAIAIASDV